MRRRDWPALDPALFSAALVTYAVALPRGVARVAPAAAVVVDGLALGGAPDGNVAPLCALVVRVFAFVPLADPGTRAGLASAVLVALAVTAIGRLCLEVLGALRPQGDARVSLHGFLYEPVAAVGAAAIAGMSLAVFHAATTAGSAAVTLAVVAYGWTAIIRVARAGGDRGAALTLALIAGLAASVEAIAAPLLWPPLLGLWLLGLRRGERWPLVAPLLFAATLSLSLFTVAVAEGPVTLAAFRDGLWPTLGDEPWQPALELGEQLGVVALLLGAAGAITLLWRTPKIGVLALYPVAVVLSTRDPGALALTSAVSVALAASAVPIAVGIAHLAGRLGRARLPGAATLALIAVVSPMLDGGGGRWSRDGRLPARLIDHALASAPLRASVNPGTREMETLLRLASVMGLRPDLDLVIAGGGRWKRDRE